MPLATKALAADSTSSQVVGTEAPAAFRASALYQRTGVELLKGIDKSSPSEV